VRFALPNGRASAFPRATQTAPIRGFMLHRCNICVIIVVHFKFSKLEGDIFYEFNDRR
jgi:hypothetical protein